MRHLAAATCLAACALLFAACAGDDPVASNAGSEIFVDQGFYPTEIGSTWHYRIDTTGATGGVKKDVARRTATIVGTTVIDTTTWAVQAIETVQGGTSTIDTLFVRKGADGVYLSSPTLRSFALVPGLPIGNFPKEFLVLPYLIVPNLSWELINFEFTGIPLIQIYFRVKATYLGVQNVATEARTFKDCARIRIDIDARFPNPENPTDILNPLVIKENAVFAMTRPFGLVMADGSEAVLELLRGRIPFGFARRTAHQEVLTFDVVQPGDGCYGR